MILFRKASKSLKKIRLTKTNVAQKLGDMHPLVSSILNLFLRTVHFHLVGPFTFSPEDSPV